MARRHRYGNPDTNHGEVSGFAADHLKATVVNTTAVGKGFSDQVIGWRGLTILVEVKRPGGKLRKSQKNFRRTWRGGPYLVVESAEDLTKQLLALDRQVPPVRGLGFRPHPVPEGNPE